MESVKEEIATTTGHDGTTICYRQFIPSPKRLQVIVSHGLGEHSGRYGNIVETLLPMGAAILIPDHRGHGRSHGKRGHVAEFGDYARDLKDLIDRVASDRRPLVMLGHSMGGLIALSFVRRFPGCLDGLVLSSPLLGLPKPPSPAIRVVIRALSLVWPTLSMANGLDPASISRDSQTVAAYKNDERVHDRISPRWASRCMDEIDATLAEPEKIDLPVLMQVAGDDRLVSAAASLTFYESLTTTDKTLCHYEALYHEIYNERPSDRRQVLADLRQWMADRFR